MRPLLRRPKRATSSKTTHNSLVICLPPVCLLRPGVLILTGKDLRMSNETTSKEVAAKAGWIMGKGKDEAELALLYLSKHVDSMLFNKHLTTLKQFIEAAKSVAGSALTQTADTDNATPST